MSQLSPDTIAYIIGSVISLIATAIAFYVSYRLLGMKEQLKKELVVIIEAHFAGKAEFKAHVEADLLFQQNLTEEINIKRGEYRDKFDRIYRHIETTEIHQPSMSSALISEKFENLRNQLGAVDARVGAVKSLIESRRPI